MEVKWQLHCTPHSEPYSQQSLIIFKEVIPLGATLQGEFSGRQFAPKKEIYMLRLIVTINSYHRNFQYKIHNLSKKYLIKSNCLI